MRKSIAAIAALPLIGLLGAAPPAAAATTLDVVSATVSRGRTLDVTLAVNCEPTDLLPDANFIVEFTQSVGRAVVQDFVEVDFETADICIGETETVTVQLIRSPGERGVFLKGAEALVYAQIVMCDFEIDEGGPDCIRASVEETITVQ